VARGHVTIENTARAPRACARVITRGQPGRKPGASSYTRSVSLSGVNMNSPTAAGEGVGARGLGGRHARHARLLQQVARAPCEHPDARAEAGQRARGGAQQPAGGGGSCYE